MTGVALDKDIVKHFNARPDDGDNIVVYIDTLNAVL